MTQTKSDPETALTRFLSVNETTSVQKRYNALLAHDNAKEMVQALPVPDFYQLVSDMGLSDAHDLVTLASPSQIQGCFDLSGWARDQVDLTQVNVWIDALLETGFENTCHVWRCLDQEFVALILKQSTRIYDHSLEEEVPEDSELPAMKTPDDFFSIEVIEEHPEDVTRIFQLINSLYHGDMQMARHIIMSARSEPIAPLEELSYRWRSGRMEDLGFPNPHRSLEIFQTLPIGSVSIGENSSPIQQARALPIDKASFVLSAFNINDQTFLAAALDTIDDQQEIDVIQTATGYLINRALSASYVSPGDKDGVKQCAHHTLASLSLGLETVTRGKLSKAAEALRTISLVRLHRLGFSVTVKLAKGAFSFAPYKNTMNIQDAALITALCESRPWFPCVFDNTTDNEMRPISSYNDVRILTNALAVIGFKVAFVLEGMGVTTDVLIHSETSSTVSQPPMLDSYGQTALAYCLLNKTPSVEPFSQELFTTLRNHISTLTDPIGVFSLETKKETAKRLRNHIDINLPEINKKAFEETMGGWLDELAISITQLTETSRPNPKFWNTIRLIDSKINH